MLRRYLLNLSLRLTMAPLWRKPPSVAHARRVFANTDLLGTLFSKTPPFHRELIRGVPVDWLGPPPSAATGVILFAHGGANVVSCPRGDRRFCADLARRSGMAVGLLDYRLAPEFPFPAALDDYCEVFAGLQERGIAADRIVLSGHSAGGSLVAGVLMRLRDQGLAQPAGALLLSAAIDLRMADTSTLSNAWTDVSVRPPIWTFVQEHYLQGADQSDPAASPLLGNWSGLAPIHFHVSDSELLYDIVRDGAERARAAGNEALLSVWHDVPHVFYHVDGLPEAQQCRDQLVGFARRVLEAPRPGSHFGQYPK